MEEKVIIMELQFIGKVWSILLEASNDRKNRYYRSIAESSKMYGVCCWRSKCGSHRFLCRIAASMEIHGVSYRKKQMWKNHYDCSIAESLEINEKAIGVANVKKSLQLKY